MRLAWLCVAGCGRLGFSEIGGIADAVGDTLPGDDAIGDATGDATTLCAAHPMLGSSGCLTGGPHSLWLFYEAGSGTVPDSSGRGCAPLASTALPVNGGLDTTAGELDSGPATQLITDVNATGAVSVEIWARTTVTPTAPVDVIAIVDSTNTTPRVRIQHQPTATRGEIEGAGINVGSSLRDLASGIDHHLVVRNDGTALTYEISGSSAGFVDAPSFGWDPLSGRIGIGPWAGIVIRAAVYDRALSVGEIGCLRAAGAIAVP